MHSINEKIIRLLKGQGGNYILPFFWQHGEDEVTLRHYMEIIANCGIGAVCVESRPHPDFCGDGWWRDLDIILDEAKKRDMKVWILDDSHFPTGYANGAMKDAPAKLRRQFVTYQIVKTVQGGEEIDLSRELYEHPKPFEKTNIEQFMIRDEQPHFDDDVLVGVMAVKSAGKGLKDIVTLCEVNNRITWTAPLGEWKIFAIHLTRNRGPHRNYINMLDEESCGKLIEAIYEPHYNRYKSDFGKTIAGFFSDEPELGNGHLYEMGKTLHEVDDQPWSNEIEESLKTRWGHKWHLHLPLIWENGFDPKLTAKVRFDYMDVITRGVEKNFSYQIGDWCRDKGVEYIGHLIEDNNQHARTGSSLGHFFRGLAGQDMAGIDNIGEQVLPQGEEIEHKSMMGIVRDGAFFHYALGKLGASAAAIEPLKKGRAMCENFGNYGWEAGVHLMKYLADHFMVRGINRYVPHAFSPKEFPDRDCPPHFYAHGHNPQYRHFGSLMGYMNRICELISDGTHLAPVAILYHAEAEWAGGKYMYIQEPAKLLADRQIEYNFIPMDVFLEDKFNTVLGDKLKVNTQEYEILIVPETSYITTEFAKAVATLTTFGFPVVFINQLPTGICNGDDALLEGIGGCPVVPLEGIVEFLDSKNIADIHIAPANDRIRYLRYNNGTQLYYFFNEGTDTYNGTITVPSNGNCYAYNAWDNVLETISFVEHNGKTNLTVSIEPRKSLIVVFDTQDAPLREPLSPRGNAISINDGWNRSTCESKMYPSFSEYKVVCLPDSLEKEQPKFGGFVRYERDVELSDADKTILEISDAAEGVEVFVNGISAGIQIVPTFVYDISNLIQKGNNSIVIEVATTLERSIEKIQVHPLMPVSEPTNRCGLCGTVALWMQKRSRGNEILLQSAEY